MRKYCVYIVLFLSILCSAVPAHGAASITADNKVTNPEIKNIRKIYRDIEAGISKNKLMWEARAFEYCEPYRDTERAIYSDGKGVIRKYTTSAGSDDSARALSYYYDQGGALRFIFMKAGAVNGTEIEHRIYFGINGSRLWEDQKHLKGPGYPFPKVLPETDVVKNPMEAFRAANVCPETSTRR